MGEINRGGLPDLDPKLRSGFEKPPEPEILFEIGEQGTSRVKSEIEKSRGESRTISTFPDFRLKIGVSFYFILIYPDFSRLFPTFPDFSRLSSKYLTQKLKNTQRKIEKNTRFYPFLEPKSREKSSISSRKSGTVSSISKHPDLRDQICSPISIPTRPDPILVGYLSPSGLLAHGWLVGTIRV